MRQIIEIIVCSCGIPFFFSCVWNFYAQPKAHPIREFREEKPNCVTDVSVDIPEITFHKSLLLLFCSCIPSKWWSGDCFCARIYVKQTILNGLCKRQRHTIIIMQTQRNCCTMSTLRRLVIEFIHNFMDNQKNHFLALSSICTQSIIRCWMKMCRAFVRSYIRVWPKRTRWLHSCIDVVLWTFSRIWRLNTPTIKLWFKFILRFSFSATVFGLCGFSAIT